MTITDAHTMYRRWLLELWAGQAAVAEEILADDFQGHWPDRETAGRDAAVARIGETLDMFDEITFAIDVGPLAEGDLVAARWTGVGRTSTSDLSFFGNDVLRIAGGRFVEYWGASSPGS